MENPKDAQSALKLLGWTTIKATRNEAIYWITRLFGHYPRRDITKDGVIVADLAKAIVDEELSLLAVAAICCSTWREASENNPWLPTSGQLLADMKSRSDLYQNTLLQLKLPALRLENFQQKVVEENVIKWRDRTEEQKMELIENLIDFPKQIKAAMLRLHQVPEHEKNKFEKDY